VAFVVGVVCRRL